MQQHQRNIFVVIIIIMIKLLVVASGAGCHRARFSTVVAFRRVSGLVLSLLPRPADQTKAVFPIQASLLSIFAMLERAEELQENLGFVSEDLKVAFGETIFSRIA